jgi:hypothetical protein
MSVISNLVIIRELKYFAFKLTSDLELNSFGCPLHTMIEKLLQSIIAKKIFAYSDNYLFV